MLSKLVALFGGLVSLLWLSNVHPLRQKGASMPFQIASTAFSPGEMIPKKFTCDDADLSPALTWTDAPSGTQNFALVMEDPDAPVGLWIHWVIYGLSGDAHELVEGLPKQDQLPGGIKQGRNSFGKIGYGGPCPPPGKPHRYIFRLYALDTKLDLTAKGAKADLERAMKGHILAQSELIGKYGR